MDGFVGWTSRDQTKILLEAGLDPNTADMYYKDAEQYPRVVPYYPDLDKHLHNISFWTRFPDSDLLAIKLPCWSLGKLISIIPPKIKNANLEIFTNTEKIEKEVSRDEYGICFKVIDHIFYNIEYNANQFRISDIGFTEDRLIDGIIKTILYLIQENIIEKKYIKQTFNIENLNEL